MGEQNEAKVYEYAHGPERFNVANSADLDTRLAAARAKKNEASARRVARDESEAKMWEVQDAERDAADEVAIAEAEEKYGSKKVAVVYTEVGCVIVKRPNPVSFKRFSDRGQTKTVDLEKLVRSCLVYPDGDALDKVLEEKPAALVRAANAVAELAGFRAQEVSEK